MPDSVIGTLQGIMAAASQITSSGEDDPAGPHYLDLRVVEILAAEPFSEQDAILDTGLAITAELGGSTSEPVLSISLPLAD